jgi:hypothetical protein
MTSRCGYLQDGRRTTMGPMYVRFGQVEDKITGGLPHHESLSLDFEYVKICKV